MTDSAIEIRERIKDDRVHYRDSILTLRESHIVMNALQALEVYEKQNAEIRHRAEVAERALREFAVQVGCGRCPYKGRCGISNPSAKNDYQECYEAALRIAEKELVEKERK